MFEFMDGVVDALEETEKVVVDGVVYCLICVAKLALIIKRQYGCCRIRYGERGVSSEIQTVEKEL